MGIARWVITAGRQIVKPQSLISANKKQRDSISDVPKGHIAVYIGAEERKRFVVPVSYLNHPSFRVLLKRTEEEFGLDHPITGGLIIPCKEDAFINLFKNSRLC